MLSTTRKIYCLFLLFFATPLMYAQTIIAVTNTNDSGPGSLRQTVLDATAGDTIEFDLPPSTTITISSQILINKKLWIRGDEGAALTISGGNSTRVFSIENAIVVMQHLNIINGSSTLGGAVYNNGDLYLRHVTISNSMATFLGGGLYNIKKLWLFNCSIADNTSMNNGGGIYNYSFVYLRDVEVYDNSANSTSSNDGGGGLYSSGGSAQIFSSHFYDNAARQGGGINASDGEVTLDSSTVEQNTAEYDGGGFYVAAAASLNMNACSVYRNRSRAGGGITNNGDCFVSRCTFFADSTSDNGGAICNYGGLWISHSTFSENYSNYYAGAIAHSGSEMKLSCCTFYKNKALVQGNGIRSGTAFTIESSLFFQSELYKITGFVYSNGYNLSSDNSYNFYNTGDRNAVSNLALGLLQDNGGATHTHALLNCSEAINAGSPDITELDQRGEAVFGSSRDVGAYEFQAAAFSVSVAVLTGGSSLMAVEEAAEYQWLDCNNNYAIISGGTQQTYSPAAVGNYAVEITKGACKDTSICTLVNSVAQAQVEKLFSMYPNPAQDEVVLQGNASVANQSFRLIDVLGNTVMTGTLTADVQQRSLKNIAAGVYTLHVGSMYQVLVVQ